MWLDDFRARVQAHPGRAAVVTQGQAISYQVLWERAEAAGAAACREQAGPRHLIATAGSLETLELVIGAWMQHKIPVIIPPGTPAEVQRDLRVQIAHLPPGAEHPEQREAIAIGTSGSTGMPKLAALSHEALTANVQTVAQMNGQPEETRVLIATGMHAINPLVFTALMGLFGGWTLHLCPMGSPGSVLQSYVRAESIQMLTAPASFYRLLFQYGSGALFPSLRLVVAGGEVAPWHLLEEMRARFPAATVFTSYGSTEGGAICRIPATDIRVRAGGCGVPHSFFDVRIAPVPGIDPPVGELCLRGPTVFLGYLQEDGGYAGLDAEGFLHTSDLALADADGYLYLKGRIGGLVKVGGLMANPTEVEQVLRTLPGVGDAMCWAESHELLGNAIAAYVVPLPSADLDERTLRRECQSRLESHQMPRTLTIVAELPRAASGKRLLKPEGSHVAG